MYFYFVTFYTFAYINMHTLILFNCEKLGSVVFTTLNCAANLVNTHFVIKCFKLETQL